MATKITGAMIRSARKQKGLSQKQLADGICTQATVSLLENRDQCPSYTILSELCERLEVNITDVSYNPRYGEKLFSYIEADMRRHCYIQAQKRIGKLKFERLETKVAQGKYLCYCGFGELYIEDDIPEAIYHFNLVLTQYELAELQFYRAWSFLGLGLAYQKLGRKDRALQFLEQSIRILEQIKNSESDICAVTDLYIDIIATCIELEKHNRALELCTAILKRLTAANFIYKIDILEELESRCLYAHGKVLQATMKQFAAMVVAELRGNQELCNKIKKQNQAHILKIIKQELAKSEGNPTLIL